jgi:hypothetical protein
MNGAVLKFYSVELHRRGGKTTGRVNVRARGDKHAARVAVDQTIAVSYPKSKPSDWIVTKVSPIERPLPEQQVADWNAQVSVGAEVDYREYPEADPKRYKTRTEAQVLSGHTAVVWLEGRAGCVCCEACTPVVEGGAA